LTAIGEPAVPALIEALAATNVESRRRAARALADMGPDAREAVPALTKALDDKALAPTAADALKKIDREAAAKAGIR